MSSCLCRNQQRELGLEAHACHLRTHEAAARFEASLWDTAKVTNAVREAMGAYVKNQNLDGVTRLVECLPSMKDKAKIKQSLSLLPSTTGGSGHTCAHSTRRQRQEDQRSSRSSSVTSKLGSRQGCI